MIDSITTNLFVVLVYLFPGALFLLGIYKFTAIYFEVKEEDKFSMINLFYFCLLSFFFGVILHALTYLIWNYVRFNIFDYHEFLRLKWLELSNCSSIDVTYNGRTLDPVGNTAEYLFTETLIKEKTKKISETILRVEALSYLCKNSTIPCCVILFGLFLNRGKLTWKAGAICGLSLLAVTSILVISSIYFLGLRIDTVLRATILLK